MVEASNTSILKLSNDISSKSVTCKSLEQLCDEMQVSARAATDDVATCRDAVKQLRDDKITLHEDREKRVNIRLVGLEETAEGSDPKGFLQENQPKWIPLLQWFLL